MPSSLFVSLNQTITKLRTSLIVERNDYSHYTPADHDMALAFRVLASAHLEDYAEKRCVDALTGAVELHRRGQQTRASRCLVTWFAARTETEVIPLEAPEYAGDQRIDEALKTYEKHVKKKHGISGTNLKSLVTPIGVREADLDDRLFSKLDVLAQKRGAAAHIRVNRAKQMQQPKQEWEAIDELMPLLRDLDDAISTATR